MFARPIPVASPAWATVLVFLPNLLSFIFVRGTVQAAINNPMLAVFLSETFLFWLETSIQAMMALVGFSFFCRLLQICDPRYFDPSKIDEQRD